MEAPQTIFLGPGASPMGAFIGENTVFQNNNNKKTF